MEPVLELSGRKKKKLFTKLRAQMEFYFGDSNLAKDKFLYNLISQDKDGYVDLEVFKTFNKIKSLTEEISVLAASLSKSNCLELSEDKLKVRRITPIEISKDFDACTLFVEGLPPYADLKWVKDVFNNFGTVDYINIPRFNISQKVKGFAFIEFNSPDSVIKACQFYKDPSKVEGSASKDENVILEDSKRRQCGDSENQSSKRIKINTEADTSSKKDVDKVLPGVAPLNCDNSEKLSNKRKLDTDDTVNQQSSKKQKLAEETDSKNNPQTGQSKKRSHTDEDDSEEESTHLEPTNSIQESIENNETSSSSKKKRKHSKKNRNRHERPTLRVMSKAEWKSYRNKYLDLQRTTMSYLKKQILIESHEIREQENSLKLESMPKKELAFQEGVILRLKLSKPVENPTDIKEQIKSCSIVAYIDAPMGSEEVFIRCHASEDAQSIFLDKKLHNLGDVILLKGKEEDEYWKKILSDRETKLNTPVVRKRRGRDKLIAKAAKLVEQRNKHIYFDE